jgi:hypothetical protein
MKIKWRKVLLKFHLYGGLLCFWYLLIFGISALHFQHHFQFMENKNIPDRVSTKKLLSINPANTDSVVAISIQNSLDLAGWYLPWETYRDSTGNFHTIIGNPKWDYSIVYDFQHSTSTISAKEKSSWNILSALHGFAVKMPNAPLLIVWKIYTYTCIAVVLFSICSGIWLWSGRKKQRLTGWLIFSGIVLLSFTLMIFIYKHG